MTNEYTVLRTRYRSATVAVVVLTLCLVLPTAAQERSRELETRTTRGLTFTPSVTVGGVWDSNVAVAGDQPLGQQTERDTLFTLEPEGLLEFRDSRTEFIGGYRGYIRRYLEVQDLNGYDQRMFVSFQRMASKRVAVIVRDEYADVPTTDEVLLNGIPYARTGSKSNRLAAAVETRLTKYDNLAVRYENTWVSFDSESAFFRGGFMNEGRVDYGRRLSERMTVGGEYRIRRAEINDGAEVMWFQDFGATVDFALRPQLRLRGAGGYSVLRDPGVNNQTGGAYARAELTRHAERVSSGVYYERSFAPSFGFGGPNESQEFRGYVHMPFSRNRLYVQSSAGWRRTDPLERLGELDLDTFLADTTVGYSMSRPLRLEVFHIYTRQDSRITGGEVNRHRVGAQLVISQPMRIR